MKIITDKTLVDLIVETLARKDKENQLVCNVNFADIDIKIAEIKNSFFGRIFIQNQRNDAVILNNKSEVIEFIKNNLPNK